MGRVTNVFLEFGSLQRADDTFSKKTNKQTNKKTEIRVQKTEKDKMLETFPQTGESVELNKAEVVSSNQHCSGMIGIHGVDLG